MRRFFRIATNLSLCSLLAVACSSDDATTPNSITSVAVLESNVLVDLNGTKTLTPVARDANNRSVAGTVFTWASTDQTIATVDNDGVVRGLRLGGPVTITVNAGDKSGSVQILVTPAGVTVSPALVSLAAGASAQFTTTAVDANGTPIAGVTPQWSLAFNANSQTAATISPTGVVTANSAGIVVVQAKIAGRTGSTSFGIPSDFDGLWAGTDGAARPIELEVRFGLVTAFRMPSIPEPGCTDKSIYAASNGAPIGADGAYVFSIPATAGVMPIAVGTPTAVNGTFTSTTTGRGAVPQLDLGQRTCNNGTSQPSTLAPSVFTVTHR